MANTTPQRRAALADIHRMKHVIGLDRDGWLNFLQAWHVQSSADLSDADLADLRRRLHLITDPRRSDTGRAGSIDKADDIVLWRRRVYGAIGAFLQAQGYRSDSEAIRTTATRAAARDSFNAISLTELKQLYHAFRRKAEVASTAAATRQALEMVSDVHLN